MTDENTEIIGELEHRIKIDRRRANEANGERAAENRGRAEAHQEILGMLRDGPDGDGRAADDRVQCAADAAEAEDGSDGRDVRQRLRDRRRGSRAPERPPSHIRPRDGL